VIPRRRSAPRGGRTRLRIGALVAGALAVWPTLAQDRAEAPRPAASTRVIRVAPDTLRRAAGATALELPFAIRADEEPTGARVALELTGPTPRVSRVAAVEIAVNDDPSIVKATPGGVVAITVAPEVLGARNLLAVRLLDDAGDAVADQGAWSALASIRLEVDTRPSALPNDLALLPLPFIDAGVDAEATIAIAIPPPVTSERARLAALMASWLALDAPVPVSFTAHVGEVPDSRAVVLVEGEEQAAHLGLAPLGGPFVRMADHPAHPESNVKLLVVGGRSDAELRVAVESLVARSERVVGSEVRLRPSPVEAPAPPYAAPRWLPSGRPVPFRDFPLGGTPVHDGATSATLPVRFRVAPDLAIWPADAVAVDLGWSERLPAGVAAPRLDVELNGRFLTTLPPPAGPGEGSRRVRLRIPREDLRGFNELLVHVRYPEATGRSADSRAAASARVAISGDSVLHLERLGHFAALPDVALFVDDGYPFTRIPDLGETAIVLPRAPTSSELSATLTLAAHFAQITGRAGSRAAFVTAGAREEELAGKDVLVIGAAADQPPVSRWRGRWPLDLAAGRRVQPPTGRRRWLELTGGLGQALDRRRAELVLERAGEVGAVIGAESPLSPHRSVVVVRSTPGSGLPPFREFLGYAESRSLSGNDLLLLSGGRRWMFRVGAPFTRGHLEPWDLVRWYLAEHWLLLLPLLLLGVALLGGAAARAIGHRMRERLAIAGEAR
jgi:cellulose synthase subunit